MSMESRINMVKRISLAYNVADFHSAPDEMKLKIYKLTLMEIFTVLGQDLQNIPERYLDELKDGLHETINGFYSLSNTRIKDEVNIYKTLSSLMEANAYLLSAMTVLKEGKGKGVKYFRELQKCRVQVFEALQQL